MPPAVFAVRPAASSHAGQVLLTLKTLRYLPDQVWSQPRQPGDNLTMPLFSPAASPERERAALSRRLHKLARVFTLDTIRREPLPPQTVVQHYEDCHDAYRKYHSAEGAVHMALNDGDRFDPDGIYGQLRRMGARLAARAGAGAGSWPSARASTWPTSAVATATANSRASTSPLRMSASRASACSTPAWATSR